MDTVDALGFGDGCLLGSFTLALYFRSEFLLRATQRERS